MMRVWMTLAAVMALLLAGCSDEPRQERFVYTDILTLISYDSTAGSVIGHDGLTMSAPAFHPDTTVIHAGDRFLGSYIVDDDANITVTGVGLVANLALVSKPLAQVEQWDVEPVWLTSASLDSGRYLNLRLKLPYDTEARQFYMLADGSDLYLIHRRPHQGATFDRTYFASVDLLPLIQSGVTEVTLHVADKNSGDITALNFTLD